MPTDTSFYEDGFTLPEPSVSFLEPDGEEYHRVVLPPRQRKLYTPPWPTILPHPPAGAPLLPEPRAERHPHAPVTYLKRSTISQDNPTPCQALHHLIRVEKDYPAARQMMEEFKDLGIPIMPHRAYLDAAVHQARRRGAHAAVKKDVLDWLGYWYAFHPVKQFRHAPMVALEPLVEIILERWGRDLSFLRQVLILAAERGWAPALMPVLFRHYTISTDPETSYVFLNELAAAYAAKTPRRDDASPGAEERRAKSVQAQVQKWRNGHLRTVLGCGYVEEGRMIYQAGEAAGVVWDVATKHALVHALQVDHPSTPRPAPEEPVSTTQQVLRLAHRRSRQPVRHLVDGLTALERHGRTRLISRLSTRFLGRREGGTIVRGSTNETTAAYWWLGHIVKAREEGRHADALELFREKFYAVGLPSAFSTRERHRLGSASGAEKRSIRDRKLYPAPEIISAVLPSVIQLVKPATPDALVALHAEFMRASSMFPTVKTDPVFHLAFVGYFAASFGAPAAERWCDRLEKSGVDVGVQGWTVVAVEYAKTRKMKDIQGILDRMSAASVDALAPSKPNERTFIGVASALLKRKKHYKATAILERWHAEQERQGLVRAHEG